MQVSYYVVNNSPTSSQFFIIKCSVNHKMCLTRFLTEKSVSINFHSSTFLHRFKYDLYLTIDLIPGAVHKVGLVGL